MACEHPLIAINLGKFDGKYKLRIMPQRVDFNIQSLEERYGHDNVMFLPCGSCSSCKLAHKKQWAVRCALESQEHKDNCMVTLTYEDRLRPKKLIKRDLQKFIKDMRNRGFKFRYFGCGEYGSLGNCHFHIILFGFWPDDAKFEFNSKSGFPVYSSNVIEDVWHKGIISVSEVTPGTAAYVAGYVDKKLFGDEFVLMSKRPGIGESYFRRNMEKIYKYDNIVGQFGVASVPRYCDKLADQMFYDIEDLKDKRKLAADGALIDTIRAHDLERKEDALIYQGNEVRKKMVRSKRL